MKKNELVLTLSAFCLLSFLIIVPQLIGIYSNLFNEGSFSILDILEIVPSYALMMSLFSLSLAVSRKNKLIFFVLLMLTTLSNMFDLGCARVLGSFIALDHIKALVGTTKTELVEFTTLFQKYLLLVMIPLITGVFVFVIVRKLPKYKLPSKSRLLLASTFFITVSFLTTEFVTSQKMVHSDRSRWRMRKMLTLLCPPFNFWEKTYEYVEYKNFRDEMIQKRKGFITDAKIIDENTPEVVVMVIGERLRYANWTIHGYPRMTSPGLSKVNGLTSFPNNYSNGNSTAASIPYLMTGADPLYESNPFYKKSVLGIFREAGYSTHWITNARIDFLEVANEAEQLTSVIERDVDDTAVLAPFREALKDKKRKFILVNFRGPHVLNAKKYFSSNNEKSIREASTNKYDDIIRNTDYILSEMIKMMDSTGQKCFMVITSDHGTNLYDDHSANLYGYGSVMPNSNEIHTPLIFWQSKLYNHYFPEKVKNLISNHTKRSSNACVMETLLDAGNVSYRYSDSHRSLLSEAFQPVDTLGVMAQGRLIRFSVSDNYITQLMDDSGNSLSASIIGRTKTLNGSILSQKAP